MIIIKYCGHILFTLVVHCAYNVIILFSIFFTDSTQWLLSRCILRIRSSSGDSHPLWSILPRPCGHLRLQGTPRKDAQEHPSISDVLLWHDSPRAGPQPFLKGHLRHRWGDSSVCSLLPFHTLWCAQLTSGHCCDHTYFCHCYHTTRNFLFSGSGIQ